MRYLKLITLSALLFVWGLPLQAAQLEGLYEAEAEVADQGRSARAEAMSKAMADVLLKVGGNAALLEEQVLKSAMADASRYVQQYRYRSEELPPEERGEDAIEERLLLNVSFDSASIDSLLRRFGFSVWSAARPATLVWLAVEEGSRRVLVGANDQGLVREVLESEAQRRAIPLRLPLLDLTDQSKVRAVDVWGGFTDNIEAASVRYETQATLIGKLYSVGKSWEARWTLLYQGDRHEWVYAASDVSRVIASGVGGSADYLSHYFASSTYLGAEQLALNIDAVNGMAGFRRVNDYLSSLHGVTAVKLRRADATSASFLLEFEGGREAVLQAIHMGDLLVEVEAPIEVYVAPPVSEVPVMPSPGSEMQPAQGSEPAAEGEASSVEYGQVAEPTPVLPVTPPVEELYFRLLP